MGGGDLCGWPRFSKVRLVIALLAWVFADLQFCALRNESMNASQGFRVRRVNHTMAKTGANAGPTTGNQEAVRYLDVCCPYSPLKWCIFRVELWQQSEQAQVISSDLYCFAEEIWPLSGYQTQAEVPAQYASAPEMEVFC